MSEKNSHPEFYVYVIFRLDGSPCYVGKGKGPRWMQKRYHNRHLAAIVAKEGWPLPAVKIRQNLTESCAHEIERAFIAAIGRKSNGGPLVNQTDGGDGVSGHRHSEEFKAKMRRPFTEEHRRKLRENHRGATGRPVSEETKAKLSAAAIAQHARARDLPTDMRTAKGEAKLEAVRKKLAS